MRFGRCILKLALLAFTGTAIHAPASAEVGSTLLFDLRTGEVIAAHEPTAPWYPASLTKLMTAYVTFEAVRSGELAMTSPVTISLQARQQPPSKMGFAQGTVITVETALRIILTKSANDVSVALAEAVGGTQAGFLARMNATAAKLGMVSTSYDNPHGLPNKKQVTSARDVALLMMALFDDFPDRTDYFAMSAVRLGSKRLVNHNKLIRRFDGATGMKTGFICASGFNLAASALRGDVHLGAVVLGGLTSKERDERTAEILEKGFEAVRSGGRVVLDGFGELRPNLHRAAVEGERPPLGTVEDLAHDPDAEPTDLTQIVCGPRRPATRYDAGTVASLSEFEAQREPWRAWQAQEEARVSAKREALAAPREVRPAFAIAEEVPDAGSAEAEASGAADRELADATLRPPDWTVAAALAPPNHPRRLDDEPASRAAGEVAAMLDEGAENLAPPDWEPSPAFPLANPLASAELRATALPEPPRLPLSYLAWATPRPAIDIKIGGADKTRPDPLSGPIVGGGLAPIPPRKPRPAAAVTFEAVPSTEALTEHAADVRSSVAPQ